MFVFRWFVLHQSWLTSYESQEKGEEFSSINLENSHLEPLHGLSVPQGLKRNIVNYCFNLHAPNSKIIVTLCCENKGDFEVWTTDLTDRKFRGSDLEEQSVPVTPVGNSNQSEYIKWLEETKDHSNRQLSFTSFSNNQTNPHGYVIHTYYGTSGERKDCGKNIDPLETEVGESSKNKEIGSKREGAELEPLLTEKAVERRGRCNRCFRILVDNTNAGLLMVRRISIRIGTYVTSIFC